MSLQLNIGQETLRGLLAHWLSQKRLRTVAPATANGDAGLNVSSGPGEHGSNRRTGLGDTVEEPHSQQYRVLPSFEFSTQSPPSIITEGSQVIVYLQDFWAFILLPNPPIIDTTLSTLERGAFLQRSCLIKQVIFTIQASHCGFCVDLWNFCHLCKQSSLESGGFFFRNDDLDSSLKHYNMR